LRGARELFVFAHELAHALHRRGRFRSLHKADEEWFADWFARELLLPRRWLTDRPLSHGQIAALGIGYETWALQLAILGTAPSLMRNRGRVLCRYCGTSAHRWGCECRALRTGVADAWGDVPDVRDQLERGRFVASAPRASAAIAQSAFAFHEVDGYAQRPTVE
jgi:hypothetical protein